MLYRNTTWMDTYTTIICILDCLLLGIETLNFYIQKEMKTHDMRMQETGWLQNRLLCLVSRAVLEASPTEEPVSLSHLISFSST